ncbi:hypothetical protein [Haloplanus salinarum]|jgi:hypothetical protein|uniref:hypothetical protein n=1 Tax=Haloplanus salinarum TaxID=1912324 RepID=UPI00214AB1B9|nr:hypothetical protein [Haloplanus salinarum]
MSHSDDAESRLAAAVADSRIVATLDDRLAGVGRGERTERLAARTRRVVTDSFVYRWLTAEPDPEVIVIDLRETYTVGPFVAVVDRLVEGFDAAATSSGAVALARGLLGEFRAAPVRLLGAAVALGCAGGLLAGAVLGALGVVSTAVLVALAVAGLAGTRVTASWADLVESRVGRLVAAALEPPDTGDDGSVDVDERKPPE